MLLVRIIFIAYFTGLGLLIAHAISEFAFNKEIKLVSRINIFIRKIVFAPFYPLSLLSKQGRASFIEKVKNI